MIFASDFELELPLDPFFHRHSIFEIQILRPQRKFNESGVISPVKDNVAYQKVVSCIPLEI